MQKNKYTKQQKQELDKLRSKLDGFDDDIVLLLKKRFKTVNEVGEFKKKHNLAVYDPFRESQILDRLHKLSKQNNIPLNMQNIKDIFLEIFSISRSLEAKQKVAYLGPQGTFCEQKALDIFGNSSELLPISNIAGAFKEIKNNNADLALVPLENSLAGMVSDTLYALNDYNIFIVACNDMAISHSLCSNATSINDIKNIYSKDIAFLQCSDFLNSHSSLNVQTRHTNSTAQAIEFAKKDSKNSAICLASSAKKQKLNVLYENIQNDKENITKFITIAKKPNFKNKNKTVAMLVKMQNKSGALVKFLNSFSKANINLDKLESHTINGELVFYIQAKTNPYNKKLLEIIKKEEIAKRKNENKANVIKIVGSW
jgi:chorismate mutase/prephenate dehydratase